jgi:WD40 repeat protein
LIRRTRSAALISIVDGRQVQLDGPNYNEREALTVDYAMFAPKGHHVVTGSINRSLWVWSNQGDLLGGRLIDGSGARDNLYSIAVSPEGDTLLTTIRGQADLWDLSLSHLDTLPCATKEVKCGLFSPDGSRILTVAEAALPDIRLWDREGRLVTVLPIDDRTDPTTAVFAPEAPLLVWPCLQTLNVYDLDGHQVARLATSLDEAIRLFVFDPAGTRVAIGSYGSDIQLWSLEGNGLLLTTLKAHAKEINSLQFSRDGTRLLTSSSDGAVREFIIDSETLIAHAARRAPRMLTEEEVDRYAIPLPLRFSPASAPSEAVSATNSPRVPSG